MTSADDNRFVFSAWAFSLTLHGTIIGLAFAFVAQVKPVLQKDLFKWDVELVEAANPESMSKQVESTMTPEPQQAKVTPSSRTKRAPEATQTVRPLERKIELPPPTIEPVQPIEEKVETPQPRGEAIEQHMVEAPQPTVEAKEPEPVAGAASTEPVEARSAQHEPVTEAAVPASSHEGSAPQESPAQLHSHDGGADTTPVQVAKATASGPEVKVDHRWLAESLRRRLAEIKRYPSAARLNGWEGKVVLRAVIRADGHLSEVKVHRSSGHEALDNAAMEAIRLVCPLPMTNAIAAAEIAVLVPMVYSLGS